MPEHGSGAPGGRAQAEAAGGPAGGRARPAGHRASRTTYAHRRRHLARPTCSGVPREAPLAGCAAAAAAVAAGALLLSGCEFDGPTTCRCPAPRSTRTTSYEVTAEFADMLNVVPRSPVMVDDVTVGEVIEVERVGWHATVTLRIRDDVELPDNAIADIRQISLLGEKYVALEAARARTPSDEPARRRRHDPARRHRPQPGGRGGARRAVVPAQRRRRRPARHHRRGAQPGDDGREDRLRALLGSLEDVVGTLDEQKADIIRALESMNDLTATLNAEQADDHRRARRDRAGRSRCWPTSTTS